MAGADDQDFIARTTRTSQILVGSMVMGVVIFAVIVIFVLPGGMAGQKPAPAAGQNAMPIFTYIALAFGVTGLVGSVVVPRVVASIERRKIARGTWGPPGNPSPDESRQLVAVYQTQLIVGAALNEGVTLFALIAYMLEHTPIALALSAVLILALAARFPTLARVEQWVDAQLQQNLQERQFGG